MEEHISFTLRIVDYHALGLSIAFAILAIALVRTWLSSRMGLAALSAFCFAFASLQNVWSFLVGYFPHLRPGRSGETIGELEWVMYLALSFIGFLPAILGALTAAVILQRIAGRAAEVGRAPDAR